ncbi:adenine deaminase [Melghirimyces profundicolus]|uniref:Adenine deaminase n=1 Tax=Melghirimyces profundicolus TaxID=1242148 RepID=A0A2T6C8M7_9BACL|nr:adenine deaminase [Melghirimyces profundicolus]PTX64678.1 adenine deaminase [Melghirimyces profundicolus]
MVFDPSGLKKRIDVASKRIPADIVIKNGKIIDVFNREVMEGDIAIADGFFVGIGEFEGKQVIDAANRYVSPSFIDGHVHIESAMVPPSEFAKVVLPHGVTTVMTDPHEIANVSGTDGLQFMMDDAENIPMDIFFMLPSSVPATPFENAGAELTAEDLEPFYQHKRVKGLAEVMDYPSVLNAEDGMMDKLARAAKHRSHIDGHAAGLDAAAVNVYRAAGIGTDHECSTASEAKDRLRRGMHLLLREGSAAKDLKALLPVVNERNAHRCLFCTDDKHLDDLIAEGSIDHNVRLAIQEGLDPLLAVQMASLNAAECYGLNEKGAIAPGYEADFLLLDDLDQVTISEVYKSGKLVAEQGKYVGEDLNPVTPPPPITHTVQIPEIRAEQLQIPIGTTEQAHVIGINPNSLVTEKLIEKVDVEAGVFQPSVNRDQLKLAVVERHHGTGNIGLGIVKGLGLTHGAIASTVAHDSHNLVAAGTNDRDMVKAVDAIRAMNGGLVVVRGGEVQAALPLPIAGLMSDQDSDTVNAGLEQIDAALSESGFSGAFNPFLTLSFLTLPVIPELKLTDVGLFDVETFQHIEAGVPGLVNTT